MAVVHHLTGHDQSTAGLVVSLLTGFIAIAAVGLVLRRLALARSTGLVAAAVWGLILAIGTVATLLLGAWVVATLAGWPTSA